MRHEWRRQELIHELQRVATDRNCVPTRDTMKVWGVEPPSAYDQVFGSFQKALEYISTPETDTADNPSRQELLQELQRIAFQRNGVVRRYHLHGGSKYSPRQYDEEFGSVEEALIKTGLVQREEDLSSQYTDSDVIADIQRVDFQVDGELTAREYVEEGKYSFQVIRDKWQTWKQALAAADVIQSRETYEVTDEELADDVARVGEELGRRPTRREYTEAGAFSIEEINQSLGWSEVLRLAGYEPPQQGQAVSEENLREDFQRLTRELGHRPTRQELREFGKYTETPYIRVYGDWQTAREEISTGENNYFSM